MIRKGIVMTEANVKYLPDADVVKIAVETDTGELVAFDLSPAVAVNLSGRLDREIASMPPARRGEIARAVFASGWLGRD